MSKLNIHSIEEITKVAEKHGYYASEELKYRTFLALLNFGSERSHPGQAIYTVCLEGPPGAGKSEYAQTYTKLARDLWSKDVELIDYQCDPTTGKTELYEDIDMTAAIERDGKKVRIPGKLLDAIKKVNQGKKVVLFIDEYDKAREETDAFLLQFLQSGKINTTQHGDDAIKEEYRNNLQVILCKNAVRENLSGPLSRRNRIIRLDYMSPDIFYTVAKRQLIEDREASLKVDEGPLNLVALMYDNAYDQRELFTRLPSCSEMVIAIQDADDLIRYANAPKHIVYKTIIDNMFKTKDDIKNFEDYVAKIRTGSNSSSLRELIDEMKKDEQAEENKESLNELISRTIFADDLEKMSDSIKEAEAKANRKIEEAEAFLIDQQKLFADLEKKRKQAIENEIQKVSLGEEYFLSDNINPNIDTIFHDESSSIKRGQNIFSSGIGEWTQIATAIYPKEITGTLTECLISTAKDGLGSITAYENGFVIGSNKDFKLVMVRDKSNDKENVDRVYFYANNFIVPLTSIVNITDMLNKINTIAKNDDIRFIIDCLVYNEMPLPAAETVGPNIYKLDYSHTDKTGAKAAIQKIHDEILFHIQNSNQDCIDHIMKISKDFLAQKTLIKKR